MPYEDPDPTDPMTLHGMMFETEDDAAVREMAACFIEEYLRLGFSADRILKMFRTPGYAGTRLACAALGEETIAALIDEYARRRGPCPPRQTFDRNADGDILLPVLDS